MRPSAPESRPAGRCARAEIGADAGRARRRARASRCMRDQVHADDGPAARREAEEGLRDLRRAVQRHLRGCVVAPAVAEADRVVGEHGARGCLVAGRQRDDERLERGLRARRERASIDGPLGVVRGERLPRAVPRDLHVRLRHAERRGCVLAGVVEHVAEQHHGALARRERLEREQEGHRHALDELVAARGAVAIGGFEGRRFVERVERALGRHRRGQPLTAVLAPLARARGQSRARFSATFTSHGFASPGSAGGRSIARTNVSCTRSSASAALPVMR